MSDRLLRLVLKPLVFLLALVPLGLLIRGALAEDLGANPVEALTHGTGDWALRLLLITLAITPLRRLSGWAPLMRFRRMLGLFAFFYAFLHLSVWVWLDQWFRWDAMLEDVLERPYIALGMSALVLMVPLAATSTRAMMRRLGPRWKALHRAVYAVAVLAVLHFLWLVKADYLEPGIYAGALLLLFGLRLQMRLPLLAGGTRRPAQGAAGGSG